ncbi:hypothetical protein [Lactiplantibacillus daowaiensis]|uniref:Uncharacterized protein n=1 Tax=Lactiplantibacillus daowaiensis TaxID=2559918 RepID=A0ABW1RWT1_9LACO|nr:hypothetical protein [Lactiplantibacillus daowaiensis]
MLISHIIGSIVIIAIIFTLIRLHTVHQRTFQQAHNGNHHSAPSHETYLQSVNTINYLMIKLTNGQKHQFTAGDAADLEVALQALLGTEVDAQPMTGSEIILTVTLSAQQARQIDLTLTQPDETTPELFDHNKKTTVRINQTVVTNGRHFYAAIQHALRNVD